MNYIITILKYFQLNFIYKNSLKQKNDIRKNTKLTFII